MKLRHEPLYISGQTFTIISFIFLPTTALVYALRGVSYAIEIIYAAVIFLPTLYLFNYHFPKVVLWFFVATICCLLTAFILYLSTQDAIALTVSRTIAPFSLAVVVSFILSFAPKSPAPAPTYSPPSAPPPPPSSPPPQPHNISPEAHRVAEEIKRRRNGNP